MRLNYKIRPFNINLCQLKQEKVDNPLTGVQINDKYLIINHIPLNPYIYGLNLSLF